MTLRCNENETLPLHAFSKEKRKIKPSRRRCFLKGLEEAWRTSAHPNELRMLRCLLLNQFDRGEPLSDLISTPSLRSSSFITYSHYPTRTLSRCLG
jgi:hypothetical protein